MLKNGSKYSQNFTLTVFKKIVCLGLKTSPINDKTIYINDDPQYIILSDWSGIPADKYC